MAIHTFYADEAGHVGANYVDQHQPFHIAGGYLVLGDRKERFLAVLEEVRGDASELKGSRLTKTAPGQRRAARAIAALGEAGAIPFFWAMERAFCIAGKLVDVFLDPYYYPECSWLPPWDFDQREQVATRLADSLSPELLVQFGRAYRQPNRDVWDGILGRMVDELTSKQEDRLAATFSAARVALDRVIKAEDMREHHPNRAALNLPALMHTLRMVDRFVDFKGGRFDLVHDVTVQFEGEVRQMLAQWRVGARGIADIRTPDGQAHREFLRNLRHVEFKDSRAVVELQAADLLVSSIARVTKHIPTPPNGWTPELRELAMKLLPPILEEEPLFGGMYAHIDTKARLLIAMLDAKPERTR